MLRFPTIPAFLIAVLIVGAPTWIEAAHYRLFVVTGQSNSLGTTNGDEADPGIGSDPADEGVRFWWHNVADATTSLGDSGGVFSALQEQQGGHYPGSASHWGPEVGFVRTLARAGAGEIAVVKASRGGGGNTNWSKSAGGHMYDHVVGTVGAAADALTAAGDTFEVAGLLYLQGESDSAAEADIADTRFRELADNLRGDLPNADAMHAVIGGIAAAGTARDTVRARHESIAAATPYIDFFPNLDLRPETTDGLHFDKAAKLRIGGRFARAFLDAGIVDRRYGRLVFLGDSITQGGNGFPSYRYPVFTHLATKGVPKDPLTGYQFTGSVTGAWSDQSGPTPDVNGQTFSNVHDGHYGWRASWINARVRLPANRRDDNRGEGTLLNWTGRASPQEYRISAPDTTVPYPDPAASGTGNAGITYTPDTAVVMAGINDLGDDPDSAPQVVADLGTIIDQLRAANPDVRVFLNHLLHTNQTQAMREAVDAVNAALPALAENKNGASATSPVWLVDASAGFDPVTMTHDDVHPNTEGEQHVGARIAAALGIIEEPAPPAAAPPPHVEGDAADFPTRYEGDGIWDGTELVNDWTQVGTLTRSLPAPSDLRVIHPSTDGRWLEGTDAGWSALAADAWTIEARLKFDANPNGCVLWLGTGSRRILIEIHADRTRDLGGESFEVTHDNLDGDFHVFRVAHDPANGRYHVFRDGIRLTAPEGAGYDQAGTDDRLILGDYTIESFGDGFDATIDHLSFGPGALLPPGLDTDGNGLPDAWEYEHFGTLTGTDPAGDPDGDARDNLLEYGEGTDPLAADDSLPVFLLAGGGNARGMPGDSALHPMPPGGHPAEQAGGVRFHDGDGWTTLGADDDGSFGPEIAFARVLWDAGFRDFGIVKSTTAGGGNSLWEKDGADDSAYDALVATATAAAAGPPDGFGQLEFRGLLYLQGEENGGAEAAGADTRFATLLANLRADLPHAADLDAVLGEIGGGGENRDTTRSRHAALAGAREDIGLARAIGCTTREDEGPAIHYDADSLFLLGARMAAECFDLDLAGPRPLPAWPSVHAWYVGDHAAAFGPGGGIVRWATLHDGDGVRDLARSVGGPTFRRAVSAGSGQAREVMRFDGTNDLWADATTEFGALSGARSVALLCRVTDEGFLFDGSTSSGRTRARVLGGSWQAGASTSAWDAAEPDTAPFTASTWRQHVFTFTPDGGGTEVEHWIDGTLAATVSDAESSDLGGLILGSNGGTPFIRSAADIAEVAVFSTALDAAEITGLRDAWDTRWGTPAGPPFSVRATQNSREVPRFGSHAVLEIPVTAETTGSIVAEGAAFRLREGSPGGVAAWRLYAGESFDPSSEPLAEIGGGATTWSPDFSLSLREGTNRLFLAAVPARHAPLGSTIDAAVDSVTFSGDESGEVVPRNPDPGGELTLALVPLFSDVRTSGEDGVNTYRIPGITIDRDGVLHAVYDHRYAGGGDLPADVDVGYARSTDGGATWSDSLVIMDYDASVPGSLGNGVGDPCILHDPVTDTIWVAALWSFGNNGYHGSGPGTDPADTGQYVLTKSEDGGATWSPPINITTDVKDDPDWRLIFQGPGHGLAMRDGTLVFPSQYRDEDGVARVCSVFSTDHGATWDFGSGVPVSSPQTNENTVCELDDGRLLFSMRTPSGSNGQRAWIRYRPDGPEPMRDGTWGDLFRLPAVPDPVCQGSVIQWTSTHRGDPREFVVFGNPGSSTSRADFTLRVSPDGGDTWPVSRLLYDGPSAYSSTCILPDRSIGVLFEKDNYSRITFARVEAAWLLDPMIDSDQDGMPDQWEVLHGLNVGTDDSGLDPDGDGADNAEEFAAGTDPLDGDSRFAISSLTTGGDSLSLGWSSVPGRSYAIEESTDLANWSNVPGHEAVPASSSEKSVTLPRIDSASHFLRIRVLP